MKTSLLSISLVLSALIACAAGSHSESSAANWIAKASDKRFKRPWTERVYGIPPQRVIGSSIEVEYELHDGVPVLMRLPEMDFVDDKEGKPIAINQHIGKRPIAAFGNSDGDLKMLR